MKTRKICIILVSMMLLLAVAVNLSGCTLKISAENLMDGIKPRDNIETAELTQSGAAKAADFALRLFKQSNKSGKNTLISPLSVMAALSMTANGAKGETKTQMESMLGMTTGELNQFFRAYMAALPNAEKYKLSLANSIWFTSDERFTVNRDFLQINADYYGASAYRSKFDDATIRDINNWVNDKTDGMIPKILDNIDENDVMYLVNALAFEAEWEEIYKRASQIQKGEFTLEDGTQRTADFMYSSESDYLDDGNATGFIKYYAGRKYAFVALLPKEGLTVADYIASLDGQSLLNMLANPQPAEVNASLPKFETEYDVEMSDVLTAMGMPVAFDDEKADFSGLGTFKGGNVFISRVIHKTFISVGERGTRAGAATVSAMNGGMSMKEQKYVCLNRPFVYMLIDIETNLPFFIGTMMDVNG